ncbi:hypothetical protein AA21291_0187 [Swaminathania salitolerans LMG 21291]|nr:hypothetical protein AA21291_0187 [Swaminathania salitolerans LMG 21291]
MTQTCGERPVEGDNAPTPERLRHSAFRVDGESLRVVTSVRRLYEAGEIGDDEVAAAQRWRCEVEYAELGIVDADRHGLDRYEKGDVHTWMLGRGRCRERLRHIREVLGTTIHIRIEMMLLHEMSLSAMAQLVFPNHARAVGRSRVAAQCALALERLGEFYRNKRD